MNRPRLWKHPPNCDSLQVLGRPRGQRAGHRVKAPPRRLRRASDVWRPGTTSKSETCRAEAYRGLHIPTYVLCRAKPAWPNQADRPLC
jgi:hypothetical protein